MAGAAYKTTRVTKAFNGPGETFGDSGNIPSGASLSIKYSSKGYCLIASGKYANKWVNEKDIKVATGGSNTSSSSTNTTSKTSTVKKTATSPSSTGGTTSYTGQTVIGDPVAQTPYTTDDDTTVIQQSSAETLARARELANKIMNMVNNRDASLANIATNRSMRLFGLPHQLLEHNDHRVSSTSNLGRMFTETIILDAPIIYIKPGTSNFLPGMSYDEKAAYVASFVDLAGDVVEKAELAAKIKEDTEKGDIRYFDFTQNYARYMSNVNMLCRLGSVFMGLNGKQVPWVKSGSITYGAYDWRLYSYTNEVQNQTISQVVINGISSSDSIIPLLTNVVDGIIAQDEYVKFYVDASTSFSESANNSTTSSVINNFTDQMSEIGKELAFFSGVSGVELDNLMTTATGGVDEIVSSVAGNANGQLSTFLKRLVGSSSQLLAGSNFLAPDIWSDSSYGKSYSFTIILTTPYGNAESWYLNIFVPLMHVLGFSLPIQTSANTFTSPMLVQMFAPGWFSCDMGIVDSISIDKGGSGDAWSSSGYPNEYKISVSIRDLYSSLALPDSFSITQFFNNTGLLNYLMVNCGVDITKTGLNDRLAVFANLFSNTFKDLVKESVFNMRYSFIDTLKRVFSLYR